MAVKTLARSEAKAHEDSDTGLTWFPCNFLLQLLSLMRLKQEFLVIQMSLQTAWAALCPPPPLPLMTSADNLLPGKCVNIKLFHTFMIPVELKKKIK